MNPRVFILLGPTFLMCLALLSGCSAPGENAAMYQTRVIPGCAPDELLVSAETVLRREFPRVTVDRGRRQLTGSPVEFTTTHDSGTATDLIGGRTTMRRKARFLVASSPDGPVAELRIDVERQDTARQEQLAQDQAPDRGFGDHPAAQSPIQRDAGTSRSQNMVWTFVRRDRNLEHGMLDELAKLYERRTPEGRGESQPTAAASQPK